MKKLLLMLIGVLLAFPVHAQSTGVYSSSATGNVGIGTTNPGALFTVGNNALEVNSSGNVIAGTWQGTAIGTSYLPLGSSATYGILECGAGTTCTNGVITASGGGSGTVNSGTAGQAAYYVTTGTAVSGASNLTISGTGVAIGTGYTGNSPPANGLLVQGSVGVGSTSPAGAVDVGTGAYFVNGKIAIGTNLPIITTETSGSGNYSVPSWAANIEFWCIGGGGGGGGVGTGNNGGTGGTGGESYVGTGGSDCAAYGGGGGANLALGAAIGTATVANGYTITGSGGGAGTEAANSGSLPGGYGGSSCLGNITSASQTGGGPYVGITATANTGAGGSGASGNSSQAVAGGGAGGGCAHGWMAPLGTATIPYAVGAGGASGAAGSSGAAGGAGAAGEVIFIAH